MTAVVDNRGRRGELFRATGLTEEDIVAGGWLPLRFMLARSLDRAIANPGELAEDRDLLILSFLRERLFELPLIEDDREVYEFLERLFVFGEHINHEHPTSELLMALGLSIRFLIGKYPHLAMWGGLADDEHVYVHRLSWVGRFQRKAGVSPTNPETYWNQYLSSLWRSDLELVAGLGGDVTSSVLSELSERCTQQGVDLAAMTE